MDAQIKFKKGFIVTSVSESGYRPHGKSFYPKNILGTVNFDMRKLGEKANVPTHRLDISPTSFDIGPQILGWGTRLTTQLDQYSSANQKARSDWETVQSSRPIYPVVHFGPEVYASDFWVGNSVEHRWLEKNGDTFEIRDRDFWGLTPRLRKLSIQEAKNGGETLSLFTQWGRQGNTFRSIDVTVPKSGISTVSLEEYSPGKTTLIKVSGDLKVGVSVEGHPGEAVKSVSAYVDGQKNPFDSIIKQQNPDINPLFDSIKNKAGKANAFADLEVLLQPEAA